MREKTMLAAVIGLTFVALAVVIGGIVLGLDGQTLDSALVAIGSGAAGAVGGAVALQKQ
jgi:hypothetical protein